MRGRKLSFHIALSEEERAELNRRCRMTTVSVGDWKRARAILLLDAKNTEKETAERCGLGVRIVRKWARRYLEEGLAGLRDRPGRGRKPLFSPSGGGAHREDGLRVARGTRRSRSVNGTVVRSPVN